MIQLAPLQLDDGTTIYIEAEEEFLPPPGSPDPEPEEPTRSAKGGSNPALKRFHAMQGTIRTYTAYTLNAFRHMGMANVDKVTLEFGIKVAGEGGVPYITKGSAESNLKITVECSFKDE